MASSRSADFQYGDGRFPVRRRTLPLLRHVPYCKVQQLHQRGLVGESGSRFRHLPQLTIEALDGISRIDQAPYLRRELKEGNDAVPGRTPLSPDFRVLPAQIRALKSFQRLHRRIGVHRSVNGLQPCRHFLKVKEMSLPFPSLSA